MVHRVVKGSQKKSPRGIHKSNLVAISVYKDADRREKEAIKEGFTNRRKGKFYEATIYVVPEGWKGDYVPDINVQVNGKVYDKVFKEVLNWNDMTMNDFKKLSEERMAEFTDSVNNEISRQLKSGEISKSDIIEVYGFDDVVGDLKKSYPSMRTKEHWNSAFKWIHIDDFINIVRENVLELE